MHGGQDLKDLKRQNIGRIIHVDIKSTKNFDKGAVRVAVSQEQKS